MWGRRRKYCGCKKSLDFMTMMSIWMGVRRTKSINAFALMGCSNSNQIYKNLNCCYHNYVYWCHDQQTYYLYVCVKKTSHRLVCYRNTSTDWLPGSPSSTAIPYKTRGLLHTGSSEDTSAPRKSSCMTTDSLELSANYMTSLSNKWWNV